MKRKQQGFTLIELMIVVAIIAILAAIAIPLYLNYTAQAEGSEATVLSDGVKTAITQYYNQYGAFPTDNAAAGEPLPASISGKYVQSITISKGLIDALFKSTGVAKPMQGQHVYLAPSALAGSLVWKCGVANAGLYKYVPSVCRTSPAPTPKP